MSPFGILSDERLTGQGKSIKTKTEGGEDESLIDNTSIGCRADRYTPVTGNTSHNTYQWQEYPPGSSSIFLQRLQIPLPINSFSEGKSHNVRILLKLPYITSDHRELHTFPEKTFSRSPTLSLDKFERVLKTSCFPIFVFCYNSTFQLKSI